MKTIKAEKRLESLKANMFISMFGRLGVALVFKKNNNIKVKILNLSAFQLTNKRSRKME
jgi:hypothetical protein